MLIGVIGLNGSGKDTVASYLKDKYGFEWISLGEVVRDEVRKAGLDPLSRDNMNFVTEGLRKKEGPDYLVKRIIPLLEKTPRLVLSSFRHPSEIVLVKKNKGIVIRVDADLRVRYERTVARVKANPSLHGDAGSFEEFKLKQERELSNPDPLKMQMAEVMKTADYVIDNNNSPENLFSRIDLLMKKISYLQQ